MNPTLTPRQAQLLNYVSELINFGGDLITSYQFDQIHKSRKATLIGMVASVHNYSESIFILLKELRTNAAEALIRPLYESVVNCSYILCTGNFANLKRFMSHDEYDLIKLATKIKRFLAANPEVSSYSDSLTNYDWDNFIKVKKKEIKNILGYKYRNLAQLPPLQERARQVDLEYIRKHSKPPKIRLEYSYFSFQWQLSTLLHLTSRGINTFFKKKNCGKTEINLSGDPESLIRIASATYSFYYLILEMFAKQFHLFKLSEFKKYKKRIKEFTYENE